MNVVKLETVCFHYGNAKEGKEALHDVSLAIPQGSFFALLGENGAGKTTLMRLICGRLQPSSGKISLDRALAKNGLADLSKFGMLIENPGDYPRLTVAEYLDFFAKLYGVQNADSRIRSVLENLDFCFDLNMRVGSLSLGNRQKLQIARSILHNPKILLLDEPAANLDPIARESLWKALAKWRKEEKGTLIVCSHILPELDRYATHYAILKQGNVALQGNVETPTEPSVSLKISSVDLDRAEAVLNQAGIFVKKGGESLLTELYKKAVKI